MRFASFFVLPVLLFGLLALSPCPLSAQQELIDTSKIQDVPFFDAELSNDDFLQKSDLYREEPLRDPHLAYAVNLPFGWTKSESGAHITFNEKEIEKAQVTQRIMGEIAKYYGPGRIEEPSRFEVHSQSLDFDVTAKNWFLQETLLRGFTLEGMREYSDKRVEALYVTIERNTSFIVRAVAEINGPRIVVASFYVPEKFWMQERAFQQRAIQSFHFLNPEKTKIELTRTYAFLDLLSFDYPVSWRLIAPNIYSIEGMEAKLIHSHDARTLGGEINIAILSSSLEGTIPDELRFIKEELKGRGMELGEIIETKSDYARSPHLFYNHTERYKLVDQEDKILDHEFWLSILEEERYFYVVSMVTPGRKTEFYSWARNAEAFETVVESFKP